MFKLRLRKRVVRRQRRTAAPDKMYLFHKEAARALITARLADLAPRCGVTPKRVAIRNTKRNWGSCSSLGNLNFNYKVALLPPCLRDYIIIHELCHLIHLNHKPVYWAEVGKYCPLYESYITMIRTIEKTTQMKVTGLLEYSAAHTCTYCEIEQVQKQ